MGEETLYCYSQLGVAFAGFTGVAAVLGRHAVGDWTRADVLRFWQMLEISLLLVVLPMLPVTVGRLHGDIDGDGYFIASIILLVLSGLQMSRAAVRTIQARRADRSISLWFTAIYLSLGLVVWCLIASVCVAGGLVVGDVDNSIDVAGGFSLGLYWHLGLATVLFWRLMKYSGIPLPPPIDRPRRRPSAKRAKRVQALASDEVDGS